MLDQSQIAAASRILHDHWRAGTKLEGLEKQLRPRDRAEAYAIQAAIENHSSEKLSSQRDRDHRHLPPAAGDSIRRFVRG